MEYIPRIAEKKLIITEKNFNFSKKSQKNLKSITVDALNIEDNILFNENL